MSLCFQKVLPKESCVSAKACTWCGEERFCLKRSVAVTFSNAILSKTFEKLSDLEVGETSFTQQTTQKYVYLQIKMKLKILSKDSLKWKNLSKVNNFSEFVFSIYVQSNIIGGRALLFFVKFMKFVIFWFLDHNVKIYPCQSFEGTQVDFDETDVKPTLKRWHLPFSWPSP